MTIIIYLVTRTVPETIRGMRWTLPESETTEIDEIYGRNDNSSPPSKLQISIGLDQLSRSIENLLYWKRLILMVY